MAESIGERSFVGHFSHTVDPQRRLAIPSEWRSGDAGDCFVLLPARDHLIQAIPEKTFQEEILSAAKKLSLADAKGMRALALLGSRALRCICDKQGRIQLSPELMEYAGLSSKAVLVGSVWLFQLWSPEKWAEYENKEALDSDEEFFNVLDEINTKNNSRSGLESLFAGLKK